MIDVTLLLQNNSSVLCGILGKPNSSMTMKDSETKVWERLWDHGAGFLVERLISLVEFMSWLLQ